MSSDNHNRARHWLQERSLLYYDAIDMSRSSADDLAFELDAAEQRGRERALEESARLHAEHVSAQLCMADSGMPARAILLTMMNTFRSADWLKVLRDLVKR